MKEKLIISLILFVSFVSCSPRTRIQEKDVEEIVFYAMAKHIDFSHRMDTFQGVEREGADTLIQDRVFIQEFIGYINDLKPLGKEGPRDFRSAAVIRKRDQSEIIVLFGEHFGTLYDNQDMIDNPLLFKFIDEKLYATQPEDYWWPEPFRTRLREMNDILTRD